MSHLLDELMDLLGYDPPQPVKLTGVLTASSGPSQTVSDSTGASSDLSDRSDRKEPETRGRFQIGATYSSKKVQRICAMSAADRVSTEAAGWPRAGAVVIEGVELLVDDVTRLMLTGKFLVLGFVDAPESGRHPSSVTTVRGRKGKR